MLDNTTRIVPVGIGEIRVTREAGTALVAYGLGSCVGVVVWDPVTRVGGMAHVALPESSLALSASRQSPSMEKFADTGVRALIDGAVGLGASKARLQAWIAGGARMFDGLRDGTGHALDIGARNVQAVHEALDSAKVPIVAADTGGNLGRTLTFLVGEGRVFVRVPGMVERQLQAHWGCQVCQRSWS